MWISTYQQRTQRTQLNNMNIAWCQRTLFTSNRSVVSNVQLSIRNLPLVCVVFQCTTLLVFVYIKSKHESLDHRASASTGDRWVVLVFMRYVSYLSGFVYRWTCRMINGLPRHECVVGILTTSENRFRLFYAVFFVCYRTAIRTTERLRAYLM